MNNRSVVKFLIYSLITFIGTSFNVSAQESAANQRTISKVTDNLYQFRNNFHSTVFLVTPEGIVLADPINNDAAKWLKDELDKRFDVPVKYVIYSHYHGDHVSGGAVFSETATFVAHERTSRLLTAPLDNVSFNTPTSDMDVDRNGKIDRSEARRYIKNNFDQIDQDDDGLINGKEYSLWSTADVRVPDVTYEDRKTITLGGMSVELIHPGKNHTEDSTVLLFPGERALFAVDFVEVNALPYRDLYGAYINEWLESIKEVEQLDFDIFISGHLGKGKKADIVEYRQYFEELLTAVAAGIKAGKSVQELQKELMFERYKDWQMYDAWRAENIAGVYKKLKNIYY